MSGGVDSSVSAALLKDQGYDVTGIMLKLWRGGTENNDSGCCNVGAAEDARRVADVLDIPFYVFNMAEKFERTVIEDFRSTYARGQTPNPCVRCNQWIKFDALLERAKQLDADVLATGHYARVTCQGDRFRLLRGTDRRKDQSYVMWMLTQEELRHVRFPVGDLEKSETRAIAEELGLRTARKPDSQEICFVRSGEVGEFVSASTPEAGAPGRIVDTLGRDLGSHHGISNYTIGQRKGLGISVGVPLYVTGIDASSKTVTVGDREALEIGCISVSEASFVSDLRPDRVLVQHRAHGDSFPGRLSSGPEGTVVEFEGPVTAVAPGQSAAFYSVDDPDELLGGGIVAETAPINELV